LRRMRLPSSARVMSVVTASGWRSSRRSSTVVPTCLTKAGGS
jgi:hypothetical protein